MKAISLWQPWASAIALGIKRIETRGWPTNYRGPIIIHAAKRWTKQQREFAGVENAFGRLPASLPLGALVAVVQVIDCVPVHELLPTLSSVEKLYGDYSDGRFGWLLDGVQKFPEPIKYRGAQGFFNVPLEVLINAGALD